MNRPAVAALILLFSAPARLLSQAADETAFLVAPADEGVVLRWAWPEGERPLGYHIERREMGTSGWIRLTGQPIVRIRSREQAQALLGELYYRYESLLFPPDPLDEVRDPESFRSLLLLMADLEPTVASLLGLRFDDSEATTGTSFYYRLIAVTRSGERVAAVGGPAIAGSYVPALPPDSLIPQHGLNGILLRWSSAGAFSAYHVFRRRGVNAEWERINTDPVIVFTDDNGAGTHASPHFYRDSTAQVGDTLAYAVAGMDPFGRLSRRSPEARILVRDVSPPAPPAQLTTGVRGDTVVLSWVPSPDPGVTTYRLFRSAAPDQEFQPITDPLPASVTTFSDVGRPAGQIWWYRVTAADAAGNESEPSFLALAEVPDLTPPEPPVGLSGMAIAGLVSLQWETGVASDLRGYRVYRSPSTEGTFALLNDELLAFAAYDDNIRRGADHPFYYRVTAVDSAFNESVPSAVISVRPPDSMPPSAPVIARISPRESSLVASLLPNPEPDVVAYKFRWRARGEELWQEPGDSVLAPALSDSISPIPPRVIIEVAAQALDDAGNRSPWSRSVFGEAYKRTPPEAPQLRRASFRSKEGLVLLEWGQPSADVIRVHVLRRMQGDSTWVDLGTTEPTSRRYEDHVWQPGSRYEYTLRVLDQFGNAAESRIRHVRIPEAGR